MTLLLPIYMMCYMSIPAGKHRSLAPHCSHVSQWRTTKTVATQSVPACSRNLHLPTHFVRRDNQPYYFRILPSLSMPLSRTYRHRNSVGHQRGRWECHPSLFSIGHLNHMYHLQSFRSRQLQRNVKEEVHNFISLSHPHIYHYTKLITECQVFLQCGLWLLLHWQYQKRDYTHTNIIPILF